MYSHKYYTGDIPRTRACNAHGSYEFSKASFEGETSGRYHAIFTGVSGVWASRGLIIAHVKLAVIVIYVWPTMPMITLMPRMQIFDPVAAVRGGQSS